MRRVQARRAIAKVLLQNPDGITSSEIVDKLDPNVSRNSIRDGRHVSNLLRGAKGIMKSKENYNGGVCRYTRWLCKKLHGCSIQSYRP